MSSLCLANITLLFLVLLFINVVIMDVYSSRFFKNTSQIISGSSLNIAKKAMIST